MSLKLGSTSIGSLYLGSTKIGQAYLGSTLVYQAAAPQQLVFVQETFPTNYPDHNSAYNFPTSINVDCQKVQIKILSSNEPTQYQNPTIELYTASYKTPRETLQNLTFYSDSLTLVSTVYDSSQHCYESVYTIDTSSISSSLASGNLYLYVRAEGSQTVDLREIVTSACGYWNYAGAPTPVVEPITWNTNPVSLSGSPSQWQTQTLTGGVLDVSTGLVRITVDGSNLADSTWSQQNLTLRCGYSGSLGTVVLQPISGHFGSATVDIMVDMPSIPVQLSILAHDNDNWSSWQTVSGTISLSSEVVS